MIRRAALEHQIPYSTTIAGAEAAIQGILALQGEAFAYAPLQDYFDQVVTPESPRAPAI